MRIWIDLTNSPHVLVLRPVIDVLRARGAQVRVTARDFAQTVQLCERFGIEHEVIGRHRGGRVAAKAVGLAQRSGALVRWARRNGPFDLALGHGSNDVTVAARLLRIPCSTMFDYEWATVQHAVNCRLAQAVVLPRTAEQREELRRDPGAFIVPEGAIDAQSLIAYADLVVSAGGTMNREAVALGTPVYTTYGGRLGGVDEALIRSNRLRPLTDPRALELVKKTRQGERTRRDPQLLVDLMLGAAEPEASA